jgi:BMFP domain-containing protein YqiC
MGSEMNDPFTMLTRMWTEMAANAMQAWQPLAGSTASPDMFRKGRADFLQAWSDWSEQLMRSSAFLEAQKTCMNGNLAVRKQIRANLRRMQRELQLVGREDVDALVGAIRRSQRRVLDKLEETSDRMQALESKLDKLCARIEKLTARWAHSAEDAHEAPDNADFGPSNGDADGGRKRKRHEARD